MKGTFISLFSGCGGFDSGFNDAGFKSLGAYDIDPYAMAVHKKNIGGPAIVHDLNNQILPGLESKPEIDIVISGSPCQGFSTIGKRIVNDPRNQLMLTGGEIAIKYGAKIFISENVLGSHSGDHKKYWVALIELLENNGFVTKMVKYSASDFRVAQSRKRIILYAWKKDLFPGVEINNYYIPQYLTLAEALQGVENAEGHNVEFIQPNSLDYLIAERIKPGQKLCNVRGGERAVHTWDIPEVFSPTSEDEKKLLNLIMRLRRQIRRRDFGDADPVEEQELVAYFNGSTNELLKSLIEKGYVKRLKDNTVDLTHCFNGKYKRLRLDSISPTVDTRFGIYKNFLHPTENRGLTVREAARIQGFSDNFKFIGPIRKQYEMIGNAVPPPLAKFIAENVKDNIASKYARSNRKKGI